MQIDADGRVIGFEEKPVQPEPIPGDPGHALVSMGIYVFNARFLFEQLCWTPPGTAAITISAATLFLGHRDASGICLSVSRRNRKKDAYWRDVGTLDAYYEANMDLVAVDPLLNLYDRHWPIRTFSPTCRRRSSFSRNSPPPAADRRWTAWSAQGSIVSGGQVEHSILGCNTRINSYAQVYDSILFDGVDVGRHAKIRRAIIDKEVEIPAGIKIGYDRELDRDAASPSPSRASR